MLFSKQKEERMQGNIYTPFSLRVCACLEGGSECQSESFVIFSARSLEQRFVRGTIDDIHATNEKIECKIDHQDKRWEEPKRA